MLAKEHCVLRFIQSSRRKVDYGLRRHLFTGGKTIAIELEEENSNQEAGSLVAVDERMVGNNSRCVERSQVDDIRRGTVGMMLQRPRQRGLQQRFAPHSWASAVQCEQPIMQRQRVPFVYPFGRPHLASL
jgi:hypothetical protein